MPAERLIKHPEQWKKTGGDNPLRINGVTYDTYQDAFDNRALGEGSPNVGKVDVICMDWRIVPQPGQEVVRIAGSGILLQPNQVRDLADRDLPIENVFSHTECGAAGLYTKMNKPSANPEEVAEEEAQRIAERMRAPYGGKIDINLQQNPRRSPGLHIARAVVYDLTERGTDMANVSTMPLAFGVSREFFGPESGKHDAALAITLATGDYGFGTNFTKKTPFHVVPIYNSGNVKVDPWQGVEELLEISKDQPNVQVQELVDVGRRPRKRTILA